MIRDRVSLSRASSTPVYEQIYLTLKQRIRSGHYIKQKFPSAREACDEFNVSRISVTTAFRRLHQEGLIVMSRGRNTQVNPALEDEVIYSDPENLVSRLNELERVTTVRILQSGRMPATAEIADFLRCEPGQKLHSTTRLRCVDGEPFSVVRITVPVHLAIKLKSKVFDKPMSADLLNANGIDLQSVQEKVSAQIATDWISDELQIPTGAAVLRIMRCYVAVRDEPIICTEGYYRSDRYVHVTERAARQKLSID